MIQNINSIFVRLIVIAALTAAGLAADYSGYAGSFLRVGTSARSMAMGSAYTAEIDRGFTAYHNPAGVVFLNRKQLTVLHHFMPLDRQFFATSFSTGLPPTAGLGIAWVSAGVKDIDGRSSSGFHTETLSTSEDAVFMTFANRIAPRLSIGLNIKLLFHRLPVDSENLTGKGTGFDIGVMYRKSPDFMVALKVQDINSKYVWNTGNVFDGEGRVYNDYFPTVARIGGSYRRNNYIFTADCGYAFDMQEGYNLGSVIRFGGEYRYRDNYFFRAGFGNSRVAFGVGMNYSLWKKNDAYLDYAAVYEFPTGLAHVFTYAFNI